MTKKVREPGYYVLTWARGDDPYQNRIVKVNPLVKRPNVGEKFYPQTYLFPGENVKRETYESVHGSVIKWNPLTDGEYVLTCIQKKREFRMTVRIDMRTGSAIQHFPWGTQSFPLDILFETRGSSDWKAFPIENADEQPPWNE